MVANPIFINTIVVFVRLYWFEKRFLHIVRVARSGRSSRSRARTQDLEEKDIERESAGVNGRQIVVLHEQGNSVGPGKQGSTSIPAAIDSRLEDANAGNLEVNTHLHVSDSLPPSFSSHRNITLADRMEPKQ